MTEKWDLGDKNWCHSIKPCNWGEVHWGNDQSKQ